MTQCQKFFVKSIENRSIDNESRNREKTCREDDNKRMGMIKHIMQPTQSLVGGRSKSRH